MRLKQLRSKQLRPCRYFILIIITCLSIFYVLNSIKLLNPPPHRHSLRYNRHKTTVIGILGPFNSGTNFLRRQLLIWYGSEDTVAICDGNQKTKGCDQFPWKHAPPWQLAPITDTFIIAITRNPLAWMRSMRRSPYNLICSTHLGLADCRLTHHGGQPYYETFENLPSVWNQYNTDYLKRDIYMIRYEDLVLHFKATFTKLTNAIQIYQEKNKRGTRSIHVTRSKDKAILSSQPLYKGRAKLHGKSKNWRQAKNSVSNQLWLKYISAEDLEWMCMNLNNTLMQRLNYTTCLKD